MHDWWVVAVELVGGVLFVRSTSAFSNAGTWEVDAFAATGRFTRKEIFRGRRLLNRKSPEFLTADEKELALWWARHLSTWGRASTLWSLGSYVGLELMLSGIYALGPVGRVVLIPQILLAIAALGTLDLSGHERRIAANWPDVDLREPEPAIDSPERVAGPGTSD